MSFQYQQSTGILTHDGEELASGYSGNGAGVNNAAMQNVHAVGPIPQGVYTITAPYHNDKTGPYTMNLIPDPANEMYGRADFRLHGDNQEMNHTASEGCIIMPRAVRESVWDSGDRSLEVIA